MYSEPAGLVNADGEDEFAVQESDTTARVQGELSVDSGHHGSEDLRGANAVFGLIGAPTTNDDDRVRHAHDHDKPAAAVHDVIQSLHEQYCRALDDPHASLAGDWAAPPAAVDTGNPSMRVPEDRLGGHEPAMGRESINGESIEAIVSGARVLTDVFGALDDGEVRSFAGLADGEPIPEILRLFAPAEYLAALSRRSAALPPVLARREHHTPGIDSPMNPMPAPASTPRHEIQ